MTYTTQAGLRLALSQITLLAREARPEGFHRALVRIEELGTAALTPAPQETAPSAEPVAWQVKDPLGGWSDVSFDLIDQIRSRGLEVRPLYASPPPSAAPKANTDVAAVLDAKKWRAFCTAVDEGRASAVFYGRVDTINTGLEVHDAGELNDEVSALTDPANNRSAGERNDG